ncbi:PDZ domain-containing protein [Paenibacillus psychroresistens]|uniref:PDZ domain-containing protein n=1 Tax=Paenibacillus psychroresistens TaxID=1778678 RepID=A0A6B8RW07_9BACL|nr:PDZ domain-containing protein [Paenibacillus psychroresistens]
MSFFKDDFYSTKASKRNSFGRRSQSRVGIALLSAASGALLVLLVLWISGIAGSTGQAVQSVIASTSLGQTSDQEDNRVVEAYNKVGPAVVSVISLIKSEEDPVSPEGQGYGLGSGVIFRIGNNKAQIVTNNHVVEGGTSYEVVLANKDRRKAVLVGRDPFTDLAVLEIDSKGVTEFAEFGDSDTLKAGQTAIAIGNPLGMDFAQTLTKGIISAPMRIVPTTIGKDSGVAWEMNVIQTDAPINQGNSGGPLVSIEGKVIGINSMKIVESGVEGLGFAIPINEAKPILEALILDHKIKRPYMGIGPSDLQMFTEGLEVLELPKEITKGVIVMQSSGPAKEAGLKEKDVIVELDGKAIESSFELRKYLFDHKKIGDTLSVTYYRGQKKSELTVTLGEMPEN